MSDTTVSLEIHEVAVGDLDPNGYNPNKQSDVVARATRESLEQFGFVDPVLVRPKADGRYEIVNGEHRWKEAQELGFATIPVVIRDLTDDEAKKLTIVLNETTGDADVVLLGQLLASMKDAEDFRRALPYTDAELEHLLSIGAEDWDKFAAAQAENDAGGGETPDPVEFEVVLSFTDAKRHKQFRAHLAILEKEWGTSSVTDLVSDAVSRAALQANQDA